MRLAVGTLAVLCILLASCESSPTRPPVPLHPSTADDPTFAGRPTQSAADAISSNIQNLHLVAEFPNATIVDPRFASGDPADPGYNEVVGYAHAGDAAIWTGHYLAAEARRFEVTRSQVALANLQRALDGIQGLVDVTAAAMPTNPGLLARFLWPDTWWYGDQMAADEASHGVYRGTAGGVPQRWLGNTSRDQYAGVFFGLAIAYDALSAAADETVRANGQDRIRGLVTRMLDFLIRNGWNVRMPDGSFSTTFFQRPDQRLALLQVGRHVNPERFELVYQAERVADAPTVGLPIAAECQDPHGSYFKFNLNHITLYNLIRLEPNGPTRAPYMAAFDILRDCTGTHRNAHFNAIERSIRGPNASRDADTRNYLAKWLKRPRRDYYVDHGTTYGVCGPDRSCDIIPIDKRVNTDFLWQRSPFLIRPTRRGDGTIETPAIDYLLPYWMSRYDGVITQ
jgi:hypothetical protein